MLESGRLFVDFCSVSAPRVWWRGCNRGRGGRFRNSANLGPIEHIACEHLLGFGFIFVSGFAPLPARLWSRSRSLFIIWGWLDLWRSAAAWSGSGLLSRPDTTAVSIRDTSVDAVRAASKS